MLYAMKMSLVIVCMISVMLTDASSSRTPPKRGRGFSQKTFPNWTRISCETFDQPDSKNPFERAVVTKSYYDKMVRKYNGDADEVGKEILDCSNAQWVPFSDIYILQNKNGDVMRGFQSPKPAILNYPDEGSKAGSVYYGNRKFWSYFMVDARHPATNEKLIVFCRLKNYYYHQPGKEEEVKAAFGRFLDETEAKMNAEHNRILEQRKKAEEQHKKVEQGRRKKSLAQQISREKVNQNTNQQVSKKHETYNLEGLLGETRKRKKISKLKSLVSALKLHQGVALNKDDKKIKSNTASKKHPEGEGSSSGIKTRKRRGSTLLPLKRKNSINTTKLDSEAIRAQLSELRRKPGHYRR